MVIIPVTEDGVVLWNARPFVIPELVRDALRQIKPVFPEAVVAGGVLRDLAAGVEPKDIDIFVERPPHDTADLERALSALAYRKGTRIDLSYYQGSTVESLLAMEFLDYSILPPRLPIQVIYLNTPFTVERMDFGCCQMAYDGSSLFLSEAAVEDFMNREFRVRRCENLTQAERSRQRFERISQRYPGWSFRPFPGSENPDFPLP